MKKVIVLLVVVVAAGSAAAAWWDDFESYESDTSLGSPWEDNEGILADAGGWGEDSTGFAGTKGLRGAVNT
ncbi:MAG: hypothetical protein KAJ22_04490, partial [Candidatus Izimaplasma sp.]|nr:hypothetical protein [Candidatus Izimaplasma bacterium]